MLIYKTDTFLLYSYPILTSNNIATRSHETKSKQKLKQNLTETAHERIIQKNRPKVREMIHL